MNIKVGNGPVQIVGNTVAEKISKFTVSRANQAMGGDVPGNASMAGGGMSHNNILCDTNGLDGDQKAPIQGVYRGESMSHNARRGCEPPLSSPSEARPSLSSCGENSQQNAKIQLRRGGRIA